MLSIIIPVYNQTVELLERAVLSALAQFGVKKEIIVVDDGSTDNCVENMFATSHVIFPPDANDFRIIQKKNGGVGSALNRGIEESQYDYISWLSSDDYFYPEKSYIQLMNMKEKGINAKFSFTGFRQLTLRCNKIIEMKDYPSVYQTGTIKSKILHAALLENFPSSFINGASVIFHKKVIEKVGLFNTELKYMQDYEMWLRISKKFDALVCQDILMTKTLHENQMMYMASHEKFIADRENETATLKGLYL